MTKAYHYILVTSLLILFSSCGEFNKDNQSNISDDITHILDSTESINLEMGNTIFSMPSPIQLVLELQKNNDGFHPELLHEVSMNNSYSSDFKRALNLGVYGTDLAYCSVFEMTNEAITYFSAMKHMSEDLHINYAFDNKLAQRFTDNIGNNDSLLILSSAAYQSIDNYLKENDDFGLSSLVLAGGWIENMYLLSHKYNFNKSDHAIQEIAQQQYVLENFIQLLQKTGESDDYWELIQNLENIDYLYKEIDKKYEFITPYTDAKIKQTTIKSKTTSIVDFSLADQIAEQFIELRNTIIE
ncbi:MAG: hypothetical protein CL846_06495 [Crocinitomicaceae bacterium]|nr:hypothetical protein [Crocinitomicaceae bacterium]|tara:strand:- start:3110 stop:4006 length:897 start_codon:yes stop_codon:yes gene_type:complete